MFVCVTKVQRRAAPRGYFVTTRQLRHTSHVFDSLVGNGLWSPLWPRNLREGKSGKRGYEKEGEKKQRLLVKIAAEEIDVFIPTT